MTTITATVQLANPWGNEPPTSAFYDRAPDAITDAEERAQAGVLLREVSARGKTLAAYVTDQRRPFVDAAKQVSDRFEDDTRALKELEATLKRQIGAWDVEQARLAEQARRAQEAAQRAEQARLDAEAADARRRLEAAAERMDSKGNTEAALAVLERAAAIAPAIAPPPPKVAPQARAGGSTRMVWKAVIIDPALVPDGYKTINVAALERVAAATNGQQAVPGVEWVQQPQVSAR